MGISWNQRRRLQRIFWQIGITKENETAQRKEKSALLGDYMEAKEVHFEFHDEQAPNNVMGVIIQPAPFVYIKDLKKFLFDRLDHYAKHNLYWHHDTGHGCLPLDKIYVKVGGDKGRGSMKMFLQFCNLKEPNSPEYTLILCAFEASDTYANLAVALDGLTQQLEALSGAYWGEGDQRKQIVLVGSGDYDFLAKVTDIAGVSGTYPCLYCKTDRNQMQLPYQERPAAAPRTLQNLNEDHILYVSKGQLRPKHQSSYFNVINPALLHLEPEQYCIPYLHCLLGITKKHYDLQERACHTLDIQIAIHEAKANTEPSNTKYVAGHRKLISLRNKNKQDQLEETLFELEQDSEEFSLVRITKKMKEKGTSCSRNSQPPRPKLMNWRNLLILGLGVDLSVNILKQFCRNITSKDRSIMGTALLAMTVISIYPHGFIAMCVKI